MRKVIFVAIGAAIGWAISFAMGYETKVGLGLGALVGVAAALYDASHK